MYLIYLSIKYIVYSVYTYTLCRLCYPFRNFFCACRTTLNTVAIIALIAIVAVSVVSKKFLAVSWESFTHTRRWKPVPSPSPL